MRIGMEYLKVVLERFQSIKSLGDKTLMQLSEKDFHWAFNETSNSIAVIVNHLSGNMISRWTDFLTSDGEKPYRNRDKEFENSLSSKEEIMTAWENGWNVLFKTLNDLKEEDLLKNVYIRGEKHSVIEAIERQIAHYSYHVGQIVYIGKQLKDKQWKNLSIPKGESEKYLQQMLETTKKQEKY